MKLSRIELENFRSFGNLSVTFDERLTVLVAPNGQGKTAVLDAIRIALWPYVGAFDVVSGTLTGSGIAIDDVMMRPTGKPLPFNMERQLPCRISAAAVVAEQQVEWSLSRWLVTPRSRTSLKEAAPLANLGRAYQTHIRIPTDARAENDPPELNLPTIGYYGTGRLLKRRKLTLQREGKNGEFSRSYAYVGSLDPAADYESFLEWFFFNFAADFEQRTSAVESASRRLGPVPLHVYPSTPQGRSRVKEMAASQTPYGEILSAIANAVDQVMSGSGWTGLRYSPSNRTLVMSHPEFGVLKVDQLSDGQRNLIAMAGDIAYRCVRLNPHLAAEAPRQTDGIVLIDEIDMHLHPQWQQVVVGNFQQAFPRIQFILTTHSPQVISTVPVESIRILGQNLDQPVIPSEETRGIASSSVLSSIFGTDPIPNVPEADWLSRYLAQIQQGIHNSPDGLELREKLIQHFGKNHPVIRDADRMIRLEEFKRRLPLPATLSEG